MKGNEKVAITMICKLTQWNDLKVFATELAAHGELLPRLPLFAVCVHGACGRVVRDLGHKYIFEAIKNCICVLTIR